MKTKRLFTATVVVAFSAVLVLGFVPPALGQTVGAFDASSTDCIRGVNHYIVVPGRPTLSNRLLHDLCSTDRSKTTPPRQQSTNALFTVDTRSVNRFSANGMPRYFVTDLGTLGGTQSFAYALNDLGQVVGFSWITGDASGHSFLYSNGKMTDLFPLNSEGVLTVGPSGINNSGQIASGLIAGGIYVPVIYDIHGSTFTLIGSFGGVTSFGFNGVATSINNRGDAAGYSYLDDINRHAFFYSHGIMRDIGSFGGYSAALAINDDDLIVGFASDLYNGTAHAFVYKDGVMKDIDPSADFRTGESLARDVNNRGQVVGEFLTPDQSAFHGFIYDDGLFTDIGVNGSPETVPFGINDQGRVVGITFVPYQALCPDPITYEYIIPCTQYKQRAFFFEDSKFADLNSLIPPGSSWELTWAFDINNRGQIVGYGLVQDKLRAFLLTPATIEQCKNGGWQKHGFKNQGQCIQFVNTGK